MVHCCVWKVPGRVGDAAVAGGAAFADGAAGGCGSTGDGDLHLIFMPCHQVRWQNYRGGTKCMWQLRGRHLLAL